MSDDTHTTESGGPVQEGASPQPEEQEESTVGSATTDNAANGARAGNSVTFTMPPVDRLMVGLGGAAMAVSALLSWVTGAPDATPNVSGIGFSSGGAGLIVFLVGMSLLMRSQPAGKTLGMALGGFSAALIFIVRTGTDDSPLALGAWIGLVGAGVAVLGAVLLALDSDNRPAMSVNPVPAALGAVLAVVASFWLVWGIGLIGRLDGGLSDDVVAGMPVLILGAAALVVLLATMVVGGIEQLSALVCQVGGTVIAILAVADVAGSLMTDSLVTSGPLVALIGGVMLARSVSASPSD